MFILIRWIYLLEHNKHVLLLLKCQTYWSVMENLQPFFADIQAVKCFSHSDKVDSLLDTQKKTRLWNFSFEEERDTLLHCTFSSKNKIICGSFVFHLQLQNKITTDYCWRPLLNSHVSDLLITVCHYSRYFTVC